LRAWGKVLNLALIGYCWWVKRPGKITKLGNCVVTCVYTPITVKFGVEDDFMGPIYCARFDPDRQREVEEELQTFTLVKIVVFCRENMTDQQRLWV